MMLEAGWSLRCDPAEALPKAILGGGGDGHRSPQCPKWGIAPPLFTCGCFRSEAKTRSIQASANKSNFTGPRFPPRPTPRPSVTPPPPPPLENPECNLSLWTTVCPKMYPGYPGSKPRKTSSIPHPLKQHLSKQGFCKRQVLSSERKHWRKKQNCVFQFEPQSPNNQNINLRKASLFAQIHGLAVWALWLMSRNTQTQKQKFHGIVLGFICSFSPIRNDPPKRMNKC